LGSEDGAGVFSAFVVGKKKRRKKPNAVTLLPAGYKRNLEGLISNPVLCCKACDVLPRSSRVRMIFIG
jgi:hypothetical protein